ILPRVLQEEALRSLLAQLKEGTPANRPVPIGDAKLAAMVTRQMLRRVGPEVDKVFSFDDFTLESLALRYEDAPGPEGRAADLRREAGSTEQGRSFSLLLDLDAAAYRGGGMRFPEYGPHVYRPDSGAALVHACGVIRELRPIEVGRRSLLTLLLRRPLQAGAATQSKTAV